MVRLWDSSDKDCKRRGMRRHRRSVHLFRFFALAEQDDIVGVP
jgi:hypothetical protein